MKKKFQIVKITVESANQKVRIEADTEIKHKIVTGIFATISNSNALPKATISLSVDEEEIIPDDFELSLLSPTSANSLKDVVIPASEKANGSKIRGLYTDGGITGVTYPYDVRVYLTAEQE